MLSAESGEVSIEPGPYHRLWPTPGSEENLIFDLSASEAPDVPLIVDQCFFENWYGYQNDVLLHGEKLDIIQVMNVRIPRRSLNSFFWFTFGIFASPHFIIIIIFSLLCVYLVPFYLLLWDCSVMLLLLFSPAGGTCTCITHAF